MDDPQPSPTAQAMDAVHRLDGSGCAAFSTPRA